MSTPAHVAGLLVVVRPECLEGVARLIGGSLGAEIHVREHQTGRMVVTLDTPTLDDQRTRFDAIARLPGVLSVDLVCHYLDPGDPEPPRTRTTRGEEARP